MEEKENNILELKKFFESDELRKLNELTDNSDNFFKILKLENLEIRHSNFLVWLMQQNNYEFLKRFLALANIDYNNLDFSDIKIIREYKHIDILIESKNSNFVCVIENKIFSSEHDNQLMKYKIIINNDVNYKNYNNKKFLYLTIAGINATEECYIPISYKNIFEEILENDEFLKLFKNKEKIKQLQLVEDYKSIIENDIIKIPDKTSDIYKFCKNLSSIHNNILLGLQNKDIEQIKKEYGDEIAYLYNSNINAINKIFLCQKQIKADRDKKVKDILDEMCNNEACIEEQGNGKWGYVITELSDSYPFKMIDYTALPFDDYSIHFLCGLTVGKSRKIVQFLTDYSKNILEKCKKLSENWNFEIGLWVKLNRQAQPLKESLNFTDCNVAIEYLKENMNIVGVKNFEDAKDILSGIEKFANKSEFLKLLNIIDNKDYKELTLLPYLRLDYTFNDLEINITNFKEKTLEGLSVFGLDKNFEDKYLK